FELWHINASPSALAVGADSRRSGNTTADAQRALSRSMLLFLGCERLHHFSLSICDARNSLPAAILEPCELLFRGRLMDEFRFGGFVIALSRDSGSGFALPSVE